MVPTTEKQPNILVTGTPGTGKTTLCHKIAERFLLEHLDVSQIAKDEGCTDGFDEALQCPFLDEDKLLDFLEPFMVAGGKCVEYHSSEFFPERWFQAVFVVRCDNTILFDRLSARDYESNKIQQNVQCEIFQTILDEALESYKPEIVKEVRMEKQEDVDAALELVREFMEEWKSKNNKKK